MSTERFQTIPNRSVETQQLINKLKDGKPGDQLTDEELTKLISMNVAPGEKGYGRLESAMRYVLNHHGLNWMRIRGARLIRCLDSQGTLGDITARNDRQRHIARRTIKKAATIDHSTLTKEESDKASAMAVQAMMIEKVSDRKTTTFLETRHISEAPKIEQVLSIFK